MCLIHRYMMGRMQPVGYKSRNEIALVRRRQRTELKKRGQGEIRVWLGIEVRGLCRRINFSTKCDSTACMLTARLVLIVGPVVGVGNWILGFVLMACITATYVGLGGDPLFVHMYKSTLVCVCFFGMSKYNLV